MYVAKSEGFIFRHLSPALEGTNEEVRTILVRFHYSWMQLDR